MADNVEPSGAWNPAMELVISRITGIQYPLEDVEATMFHDYFDVDRRDIDIRGGVILIHDGHDYRKSNHQWCLNHRMLIPHWYPYAVLSLTLRDSDVIQTIDPGYSVGLVSISKYNTKVVMQGSVSRVVPNIIGRSQIAKAMMSETYNGSADGGPATSFLPFAFIMPSNETRRSPCSGVFRYTLVTAEDVSTASNDQQLSLTSDGSKFSKEAGMQQQLGGIHRMFQMASSGLDPTIQFEVMKEPVLMLHDDNSSPHDIAHELQSCAVQLGVGYYSLDARLLFQYPFKATRSDQSSTLLHPLSYSNRPAGKVLSHFTAEHLARAAPFLLHVENVDMVLLDPASQASSVQINGEEEVQDKWCRVFKGFMSDLYGHLHRRRRRSEDSSSDSCRLPPDCVITTVVTASQTNAHQFKGVLKSMFSSEIALSTATCCSILDRTHIERVVGAILNRKGVGSSVSCDAEIVSAMGSYLSSSGWSYSSYRLLAEDTLCNAFVRSYCDGFSCGNDDDGDDGNDELFLERINCIDIGIASDDDGYIDSSEIEVDVTDVAASLDRIPCLREGFRASVFEGSSNGHKSFHEPSSISPVHWQDIGGLDVVRKEILDVLELPYKHPHLFRSGYPRRQGILLYGPPGTGKTLVAKAVATECNIGFVSVKGPELLDSYIGESERNIRELFEHAKQIAPCVLFFDEIDSIAPARAKNNDSSGGVMDRIVSQLLTEIDMIAAPTNTPALSSDSSSVETTGSIVTDKLVFVIAATNRPDLLDSALLRPGRFDRKIYLGVCEDVESRHQILRAQTRKFDLSADVDLLAVARVLPRNVTGADISGVTGSAFSSALERKISQLTREALLVHDSYNNDHDHDHSSEEYVIKSYISGLSDDCITVQITSEDFDQAVQEMKPSLIDLSYYDALHRMYSDNPSC